MGSHSARRQGEAALAAAAVGESRFIILRDQSSSMGWVPKFPQIWNEQIVSLARLIPGASAAVYSVHKKVEKTVDSTPLADLERIDPKQWHSRPGGLLKGGTSLGDAVIRGCQKAQCFRKEGFEGPIGIFLLTDGWSRNDTQPLSLARRWLDHARENLGVTFRLISFVTPVTKFRLELFKQEVDILPEEDQSICYERPSERSPSMETAMERLSIEACATVEQEIPIELLLRASQS